MSEFLRNQRALIDLNNLRNMENKTLPGAQRNQKLSSQLLAISISMELVSSSARVTSVKSKQGLGVSFRDSDP